MKEVEAKFKIHNSTFENVITDFGAANSELVKYQHDIVYLFPEQMNRPIVAGSKIARVRTTSSGSITKHKLTLKIHSGIALVSDEYEVAVDDAGIASQILLNLGMQEYVEVKKKRYETTDNAYNICIDEVEGLGLFIEVETLLERANNDAILLTQEAMKSYLQSRGYIGELCDVAYDVQLKRLQKI